MKQADINWFQPLWRRVAVTAFCVAWAAFEWWNGDQLWALLTTGAVAYCIWSFFISFKAPAAPAEAPPKQDEPPPPQS